MSGFHVLYMYVHTTHIRFDFDCHNFYNVICTYVCTMPPKNLHTFISVWSKTTLNTCGVGHYGKNFQAFETFYCSEFRCVVRVFLLHA